MNSFIAKTCALSVVVCTNSMESIDEHASVLCKVEKKTEEMCLKIITKTDQ